MKLRNYLSTALTILFLQIALGQNGLSFDGIDDKVDLGNGANLQLTGNSLTIEAWIYPTSWRTNVWEGGIVVKEQPTHQGYMFRAGQSGRLNFAYGNGTQWKELTTNANALSLNVWQHVAATYDGTRVRLYKNGVRIDSANSTGVMGTNSNSCVIGAWFSTGRNFPGKIDEVRIWNIVRTQAEIAGSMNGEFCGAPSGLQAYYKFNQGTAGANNAGLTTLTDATGNSNGTLQNFSLSGTTSNWVSGKTLSIPTGGSSTFSVMACDSYTSPSGDYTWTQNGQYMDTILSPLGCDSIMTINLTVNSSNSGSLTTTACNTYTSPSGDSTWSASGTYTDILTNVDGCDSVLTINLTINTIDTNVLQNGIVLTSWATGATYQWLDCGNGYAPVNGATGQVFVPTASGSYAVEITGSNCVDTSACYTVTGVGLEEDLLNKSFIVYPNPSSDVLHIQFKEEKENIEIEILSLSGELLWKKRFTSITEFSIDADLSTGMYLLRVQEENVQSFKKVSILK